jgi:hypothetical protein
MKSILFIAPIIGLAISADVALAQSETSAQAAPTEAAPPAKPAAQADTTAPAVAATTTEPAAPAPATPSVAPPQPLAAAAPGCELHVWPAARVGAVTQGAGSMFGLLGAIVDAAAYADQNKRDKAFITSALDAPAQARALKEMDLPRILNLPPANVITHDEGIELTSETTGRLAQSSAPCYYDVVVRQLFYFKSATTKGKMRTFIMVRGADGNSRVINYKDSANHALDVKLPNEGEDATPASRALIEAFKADVNEFSAKFVRKTAAK